MSTAAIQTMLPQFGQIERRAVGPHGASRIKMEGSEKASLRNMRFLLAQHPVGVRVLQAAREATVGDTRTPNPNPNPNASPNPNRSPRPRPSPSPSPSPSPNPSPSPSLNPSPSTARPVEIYQYLEPLYNDYRKVRVRLREGGYGIVVRVRVSSQP